ncbi:MAG: RagB/SusD family nutrient uptake outer membrane protein [Bacteroidales bacterium]|nr:RagB/SusD family nutrient uptake outer membrane protein [Bacteroidales bacterium]
MKASHYILWLVLLSLLFNGCNDFLDVVPKGKNTLSSLEDLETLLNDDHASGWGIFSEDLLLITNELYPAKSPAFYIAEGKGLVYGYMTYDETVDRVSLTEANSFYSQTYKKITTYNVLISKINDVSGDHSKKQALIAEAKTLRAWCHWMLANVFAKAYTPATASSEGGIPYVTDVNFDSKNEKLALENVYQKLLEDLNDNSIDQLPDTPINMQRVGKAFGYAVRAKVHLSMQNYTEALKDAEKSLSFNDKIEDRKPFIGSTPVREKEAENNLLYAPGSYSYPLWNVISAEWAKLYERGDIMRWYTDLYEDASGTQGIEGCYTWKNGTRYICNSVGIRTEDMILVKAECLARGNNTVAAAMETLNDLRKFRIHPDDFQKLEASSGVEAMKHVMNVSRIEYLFTYNNFFNLKRWNTEEQYKQNITRTVNGKTYTLRPDSPYWVMPFPAQATRYNPSLTQNF